MEKRTFPSMLSIVMMKMSSLLLASYVEKVLRILLSQNVNITSVKNVLSNIIANPNGAMYVMNKHMVFLTLRRRSLRN